MGHRICIEVPHLIHEAQCEREVDANCYSPATAPVSWPTLGSVTYMHTRRSDMRFIPSAPQTANSK